jgi:hypothetical protein
MLRVEVERFGRFFARASMNSVKFRVFNSRMSFPVNFDVRNKSGKENEVNLTFTKDLVRNVDAATFSISRSWQQATSSYASLFLLADVDVCYWHLADMTTAFGDVRLAGKAEIGYALDPSLNFTGSHKGGC